MAILPEDQIQIALAAKAILHQDHTHQIQEAKVVLQDPTAQAQIIPTIAAEVAEEDHHPEEEEDNF